MSWFINQCENQDCRNVKMTVRANDFSMECKNFHLLTCTTFVMRRLPFCRNLILLFFCAAIRGEAPQTGWHLSMAHHEAYYQ